MRASPFFRSVKYGIVFSIVIMILTFIVRQCIINSFGENLTGYYLLINQLVGYLNLAELGLTTASVYLLFKPLNSENKYDIVGYFYIIHRIFKFIASAILFIGLTLSFIMPYLVKDNINWHDIYIPWVFYVIATALSYFYSAETVLLTASEKLYIVRIVNGLARVITFLIQIVVLKNGGGFIIFSALEILYALIQYILFRYYVLKLYGAYLYSKITLSKELPLIKQTIIKEIKKTFIHKLSGVMIFNTDYIIISIFIGLSTIYSSYLMFIQASAIIIGTIVSPLGAYIGNFLHRTDSNLTYLKFNSINTIFFLLASIGCIIYNNISTPFVQLWMGKDIIFSQDIVALLAVNFFCLVARSAVDIFKVAYGYMSDIHLPIIEGTLNLIISLSLVNFYGVKGVIYGTICSNVIIIMLARPWYLYKEAFNLCTIDFIKDHIQLWVISLMILITLLSGRVNDMYTLFEKYLMNNWDVSNKLIEQLLTHSLFLILSTIFVVIIYIIVTPKNCLASVKILTNKGL